jgi:Tol biopolymer transport system component
MLGAAAAAGSAAWLLKPSPPAPHRKFELHVRDLDAGASYAISPDGDSIAYVSGRRLWIQRLDQIEPHEVPGTADVVTPCWSPDSRWVAFISGNKLQKVAVADGASAVLGTLPESITRGAGVSWGPDDRIALAPGSGGLYEFPATGGDARVLLASDPTRPEHYHEPSWLPDGRGLLFTIHRTGRTGESGSTGVDTIAVLEQGRARTLLQREGMEFWRPVYSRTGHILYRRQPENAGVWALPFSLSRRQPAGEPFLVMPLGDNPSVSLDGTLVALVGGGGPQQLVWVDRNGNVLGTVGQPQPDIQFVSLSPDGTRAAVTAHEGENWDIWIHDIPRGTKTRLTFDKGRDWSPVWAPDGRRVLWLRDDTLYLQAADGSGQPAALGEASEPGSFSPDGQWILCQRRGAGTSGDLWLVPVDRPGEARLFLGTKAGEWGAQISPDGRYAAYTSDESGLPEIYLKRFPSGEGKWQVSANGGNQAVWSRHGDAIVYRTEDTLVQVPIARSPDLALGTPVELFKATQKGLSLRPRAFDVAATGDRILTVQNVQQDTARRQLVVSTSWFSEFPPSR